MFKFSLAVLTGVGLVALASGCAVDSTSGPEEADVAESGELLCSNPSGVNSVMTALAVATAQELRRWNAPADFRFNYSSGMLELSSSGRARCWDGSCKNVQAILDMQKWEAHQKVTFPGNIKLDVGVLRAKFKDGFERQQRCNYWWDEYKNNGCWVEDHDLWFDHAEKGSCDTKYFFWRNKAGTNKGLDHADRLQYQLYFVGYPDNRMLNFYERDWQVSVDPTGGLNEGSLASSGSCSSACVKYSAGSVAGQCCSCNGDYGNFERSSFSRNIFLCQ